MNSLIANSGIHFIVKELVFNPDDPVLLPNGANLRYTFMEEHNFITNKIEFDLCCPISGYYIPSSVVRSSDLSDKLPNGAIKLDGGGVPVVRADVQPVMCRSYQTGAPQLININSLQSLQVNVPGSDDTTQKISAFEALLGVWLPMPMFEEGGGVSMNYPTSWCRLKIERVGEPAKDGKCRYRFIWAFDTNLASDMVKARYRPMFFQGDGDKKYSLCNRADYLLSFLSIGDDQDSSVTDYIQSKLGLNLNQIAQHKYKFIGYFIYLINYLRLSGCAPEITLYKPNKQTEIPVDLSVDIGNSRTCAILFERGNFRDARPLRLRDLSEPWRTYSESFDMRIVFRKADFGNDLISADDVFNWKSIVRVGNEAARLIRRSKKHDGVARTTTHYSSPKRYLWDGKKYSGVWNFLVMDNDPTHIEVNPQVFIKNFTDYFDECGNFTGSRRSFNLAQAEDDCGCKFSRKSLMTFVMAEILQHAIVEINSPEYRRIRGSVNCRRYVRNIIVTCPTAMPEAEQKALRDSVKNAVQLLQTTDPNIALQAKVVPDMDNPLLLLQADGSANRGWYYDEALASQLVYLYAEADRYNKDCAKFIELKGHARPEDIMRGYDRKSLTVGSVDIGAGTTDVIISKYKYSGRNNLTPEPLYWDSFYLAGDDIMKSIIANQIIEGPIRDDANLGCIRSALEYRLMRMTDEELMSLPILRNPAKNNLVQDVRDIANSINKTERDRRVKGLVSNIMRNYFGVDNAMQDVQTRNCRNDFNVQVSMHIAQTFLQFLVEKRSAGLFSYKDIFADNEPSEHLLEHFKEHFGFDFRDLSWRFEPEETREQVRDVMQEMMRRLSVVMKKYDCDIILLSGRPCALDVITELFVMYYPVSPDRLIRLGQYRVGEWFPCANEQGYFRDQKAIVAVGAMVGYLASIKGGELIIDFTQIGSKMKSTAKYVGEYESKSQEGFVKTSLLTPKKGMSVIDTNNFPLVLGCKQYDSIGYSARPLYVIYDKSKVNRRLRITLQRDFLLNREEITIDDITDEMGNNIRPEEIELVQQSIVPEKDGDDNPKSCYWLDKGEFNLSLNK